MSVPEYVEMKAPKIQEVILGNNGTGPDRLVPYVRDRAMGWLLGDGLDIGCGPEKVTQSCIGIDNQSQYRGAADVVIDVHDLPKWVDGREFDWIFSSHFLEHLTDWKDVLKSWVPMLRVGGILFLYLPNAFANPHWSCQHDEAAKRTHHVVDLVPAVVVHYLKDIGMDVVEHQPMWDEYASFHVVAVKKP